MLGWVKRLFRRSNTNGSKRAAQSRPRSATGALLTQSCRPNATTTGASQTPAGSQRAGSTEFDPYNTGKFDRAASWERVRNSHR